MKYHLITYGCQMNKADSERIAANLEKRGYKPAASAKEADLVVVNMCSVRQSAVDRVFGMPMKLKGIKAKKVLTGCILKKDRKKFKMLFDEIWDDQDLTVVTPKNQNQLLVYVPISNGCNNFCAYCVVPFTRGCLICRSHEAILKEIKRLIEEGAKEIWLLGQNVNDYKSGKINFAKLVKMINDIPGEFKFFFMSPNPKNFSDELINTLAGCKKFSRYLNLPVQSGDDAILKKMKRNYTVGQYRDLVVKIRKKMPDINLSTDVIVGFPGETVKQFENTAKLFKKIKFDIAYVSQYSPRAGTVSFQMKDDISREEKKRRKEILTKLTKHG